MLSVAVYHGSGHKEVIKIMGALDVAVNEIFDSYELDLFKPDGIILLGGRDVNSRLYNQKRGIYTNEPDYKRDDTELAMLAYADENDLPVLGICRGMQLMNVYYGGNLYQDVEVDAKRNLHPGFHRVEVWGKLKNIVDTKRVNSLHHQAVNVLGDGFKPVATAFDGLTEAIWKPGRCGVQWHPELLFAKERVWFNLFRWFKNGLK